MPLFETMPIRPSLQMFAGMMPALPLPGEMMPGQFGPISRVFGWSLRKVIAFIMSTTGMPSVMQTTSSMPASAASMIASAANGGGTKITDALAPVSFTASCTVLKTGQPSCVRSALAGRDAADDFRVIRLRRLRVEGAFASGDALDDQPRVLVEQDGH